MDGRRDYESSTNRRWRRPFAVTAGKRRPPQLGNEKSEVITELKMFLSSLSPSLLGDK